MITVLQTPERQRVVDVSTKSSINVAIYVAGVITLAVLTGGGVLAIVLTRPLATDNATYIASLVGIATPIILALLALISSENHKQMNSRLDQMVVATATVARTEGVAEGAAERRAPPRPVDTDAIVQAVLQALAAHPVLGATPVVLAAPTPPPAEPVEVKVVNAEPVKVEDVSNRPKSAPLA